jgi:hypothetical protein
MTSDDGSAIPNVRLQNITNYHYSFHAEKRHKSARELTFLVFQKKHNSRSFFSASDSTTNVTFGRMILKNTERTREEGEWLQFAMLEHNFIFLAEFHFTPKDVSKEQKPS